MPVIDVTTRIAAPVQRVFDLSRSVDLHAASAARTKECAIAGVTSGLMSLGDEVTWRAKHFGVWQHLTSWITAFDPPRHFRDSLVRCAFRYFHHDHFFWQEGEITVMQDVFDFQSPFGILGGIADRLILTRYLTCFLATRNAVIRRTAETDEWQCDLPMT